MTMEVTWLDMAVEDVEVHTNYIDLSRPASAQELRTIVLRSVEYIGQFPHIGHKGRRRGTFEYVIPDWPYIIIYQVSGSEITILAVFHTSLPPALASHFVTERT